MFVFRPRSLEPLLQAGGHAATLPISCRPPAHRGPRDARVVPIGGWHAAAKRTTDIALTLLGLAFFGPLMLIVALLIRFDSAGPALFRQRRIGLDGRGFEMLKFRTMHLEPVRCRPTHRPGSESLLHRVIHVSGDAASDDHASGFDRVIHVSGDAASDDHALATEPPARLRQATRNDPRVTRVGALLRRLSLDEMPQLLNVLRGEMSIVGPRPHAPGTCAGGRLFEDVALRYDARHRVKPGMTGLAQVRGWRGETDTEDKLLNRLACDLEYIDTWSFRADLEIIWRTLFAVFRMRNAY